MNKKIIFSAIVNLGGVVVVFLTSVVLSRLLEPAEFGRYSYYFSLCVIISIPMQFGLQNLIVKQTSIHLSKNDKAYIPQFWFYCNLFVFVVFIIISLLFSLLNYFQLIELPIEILIFSFIMSLSAARSAMMRGVGNVSKGQFYDKFLPQFVFLSVVFVLLMLESYDIDFGARATILVFAIVYSLNYFSVSFSFSKARQRLGIGTGNIRGFNQPPFHLLKVMLPMGLVTSMHLINSNIDLIILKSYVSYDTVGFYAIAVKLSTFIGIGLTIVNMVFAPKFASYFSNNELVKLRKLFSKATRFSILFAIVSSIFIIIFGKSVIVHAYGINYIATYNITLILLVGAYINAFVGPVGILMNMTGHQSIVLVSVIIATVVNVMMNFTLIPYYGVYGAAISTNICIAVWNLILYYYKRKILG